jgi:oligopeptidase B
MPIFINEVVALDRGFIYAIAHIRGGEDLGRQWYDDGKCLKKEHVYRFYRLS